MRLIDADAVREYEKAKTTAASSIDREAFNWNQAQALLRGRDFLIPKADAAIAELKEWVLSGYAAVDNWKAIAKNDTARAEQAEGEVARLEWMLDEAWNIELDYFKDAAEMKAELAAHYEVRNP